MAARTMPKDFKGADSAMSKRNSSDLRFKRSRAGDNDSSHAQSAANRAKKAGSSIQSRKSDMQVSQASAAASESYKPKKKLKSQHVRDSVDVINRSNTTQRSGNNYKAAASAVSEKTTKSKNDRNRSQSTKG
jgi:hypothetical protein